MSAVCAQTIKLGLFPAFFAPFHHSIRPTESACNRNRRRKKKKIIMNEMKKEKGKTQLQIYPQWILLPFFLPWLTHVVVVFTYFATVSNVLFPIRLSIRSFDNVLSQCLTFCPSFDCGRFAGIFLGRISLSLFVWPFFFVAVGSFAVQHIHRA